MQAGGPSKKRLLNRLGVLGTAGGQSKEEGFLLQVTPEYRERNAPGKFEASTVARLGSSLWGEEFHNDIC